MNIRPAVLEDLEQVCSLYRQMYFEMAVLQPGRYTESEPDRDMVLGQLKAENAVMLAAVDAGGAMAGFIFIRERHVESGNRAAKHFAAIENYIVGSGAARAATASELLNSAVSWAREHGLTQIELNILAEDGFSTGIFENAGFTTAARVMRCDL